MSRLPGTARVNVTGREPLGVSLNDENWEGSMNPLMYGDLVRRHAENLQDEADKHRTARLCRPRRRTAVERARNAVDKVGTLCHTWSIRFIGASWGRRQPQ
jgi:hypothetical protein